MIIRKTEGISMEFICLYWQISLLNILLFDTKIKLVRTGGGIQNKNYFKIMEQTFNVICSLVFMPVELGCDKFLSSFQIFKRWVRIIVDVNSEYWYWDNVPEELSRTYFSYQ